MKVIVIMPANYILTGNLNVTGDAVIAGTVYDIKSLSTLVKLLAQGDYKDIMELTNNERIIDKLEVNGDLILVTFECGPEKSTLNVLGSTSSMQVVSLE
jgi:hypothetical protein